MAHLDEIGMPILVKVKSILPCSTREGYLELKVSIPTCTFQEKIATLKLVKVFRLVKGRNLR